MHSCNLSYLLNLNICYGFIQLAWNDLGTQLQSKFGSIEQYLCWLYGYLKHHKSANPVFANFIIMLTAPLIEKIKQGEF